MLGGRGRPRYLGAVLAIAAVLCLQGLNAPEAGAATTPAKPYDFDGDGYADLAIGVPGERVGGKDGAGAVNVLYGSKKGLTPKRAQLWSQASRGIKGKPTAYEGLGSELGSGDFDCDGRADLAIAVQSKLAVLYGGRKGLTAKDQLLDSGLRGDPVEHLTTGDFNHDRCSELAVSGYGRTAVLRGSPKGLGKSRGLFFAVALTGRETEVGGGLVAGDLTGDGIDDLGIGRVPHTTPQGESGGVAVVPGSSVGLQPLLARRYGSEDPGIKAPSAPFFSISDYGEAMAIGDFNGDGHLDLAIGDAQAGKETSYDDHTNEPVSCPGGDFCSGAVVVLFGAPGGLSKEHAELWTKGSMGREHQRGFGAALAAGDVNGDGRDDLAVQHFWSITLLTGSPIGLSTTGLQEWNWEAPSVKGRSADDSEGGTFGCGTLRLLDHGRSTGADLSVGSQHYRDYRGAVNVLYGSSSGITASGDQLWQQSSRGVPGTSRDGDQFGGNSTCYVDTG